MVINSLLVALLSLVATKSVLAESVVLISPDPSYSGTPIAVVWIQGANYNAAQYTQIAQQFQLEAQAKGYKAWVGIPDFTFNKVNPAQIGGHISNTVEKITSSGFTGDNWFLAGHSLGGVMTQDYLKNGDTQFKGQILMSSVLLRDRRSVQSTDGTTLYDYTTPTLTIGGTRDGLMRITRVAESYYHQVTNISLSQAKLFPVEVMTGVAHYQFAGGVPPSFVQKNDLKGDISDADARVLVGQTMTKFIDDIIKTGESISSQATADFFAPFLQAMVQEGSAVMKEPCNQNPMINVPTPDCVKGSPWVEENALKILVGDLQDSTVTLVNNDNFHPASEVVHYHHPEVDSDCLDHDGACTINHISITENIYDRLNEFDLGKTPIAAKSMRVKLKSSQFIHQTAREADADFDTLDTLTECRDIDQAAFDWAYSMADATAKKNYDTNGQKLVQQTDKQQHNGGLWIIQDLEWNESDDKTEMDNVSVACILKSTELVPIFRSMHYCKLLSPFRALEWIYVDSQYAFGGYQAQEAAAPEPVMFLE